MRMCRLRLLSPFGTSLLEARPNLLPHLSEPVHMEHLLAQRYQSQLRRGST